ncbi:alkaline-phosphatase-like protein [Pisolithus microcarpus]|nr:alkaline-phosphatase-like protein [Pisolithus microcarpus]
MHNTSATNDGQETRLLLENVDDDVEEQVKNGAESSQRGWERPALVSFTALGLLLLGGFFYLSNQPNASGEGPRGDYLWNGTHEFKRTVILVSIDGLRADYLDRGLTPHLLDISKQGIRAEYMKPVFPTLTFPNHWSLMTGLYPESHGIVANSFWDPASNSMFMYNHPEASLNASWWFGEPMWETAEQAGLKTANLMWPGPPVTSSGFSPTYHVPWRDKVPLEEKLDQIFKWVDMDVEGRPELIVAYEPSLDQAGHAHGPMSKEVNETLRSVDKFAHSLHHEVLARNLSDIADVIFVSDHGMADTRVTEWILVDDESMLGSYGDEEPTWDVVTHADGWPNMGLRFRAGTDQRAVLSKLMRAAKDPRYIGKFDVFVTATYTGKSGLGSDDENVAIPMPERYHFSASERIAPVWIVPRLGYALTTKESGEGGPSHGDHGYDNDEPAMRAIFVAHGPFSTGAKGIASRVLSLRKLGTGASETMRAEEGKLNGWHSTATDEHIVQGFQNVEVYNLVMRLLGVDDLAPTNGTAGFWDAYLEA